MVGVTQILSGIIALLMLIMIVGYVSSLTPTKLATISKLSFPENVGYVIGDFLKYVYRFVVGIIKGATGSWGVSVLIE